MKKADKYKIYKRLFILTAALVLMLSGCMDTTLPTSSNNYNMKVVVYVADSSNPANKAPIAGVPVSLFDLTKKHY